MLKYLSTAISFAQVDASAIDVKSMKHSMTKDHLNRCFLKVFDAQLSDETDYMCKINDETFTVTSLFVEG